MKDFIILLLFVTITASIGGYLLHISGVTIKQIILCAIASALLQPLADFITSFIKELIR